MPVSRFGSNECFVSNFKIRNEIRVISFVKLRKNMILIKYYSD